MESVVLWSEKTRHYSKTPFYLINISLCLSLSFSLTYLPVDSLSVVIIVTLLSSLYANFFLVEKEVTLFE